MTIIKAPDTYTRAPEVPAFLQKCACKDKDCPNQILWIHTDNLKQWEGAKECMGCIPIASFTPGELEFLEPSFWDDLKESVKEEDS